MLGISNYLIVCWTNKTHLPSCYSYQWYEVMTFCILSKWACFRLVYSSHFSRLQNSLWRFFVACFYSRTVWASKPVVRWLYCFFFNISCIIALPTYWQSSILHLLGIFLLLEKIKMERCVSGMFCLGLYFAEDLLFVFLRLLISVKM